MAAASSVLFGISPALMKLTFAYGGSGLLSDFYGSGVAIVALLIWGAMKGRGFVVESGLRIRLLVLSLLSCATSMLLYTSYSYLSIGLSTTLHYIYPIATALYLRCFFREHFGRIRICALIVIVAGVACMSLTKAEGGSMTGMAMALLSGLVWGGYIVYLEKSGLRTAEPMTVSFYLALVNCIVSGLVCAAIGGIRSYSAAFVWGFVLLEAVLERIVASVLFQKGIAGCGAFLASIISTMEPIVCVIVGAMMLGETPARQELAGIALIFVGIMLNLFAENRRWLPR